MCTSMHGRLSTLKVGVFTLTREKPPSELSHTADLRSLGKFEPHSVYRQFQLAVGRC